MGTQHICGYFTDKKKTSVVLNRKGKDFIVSIYQMKAEISSII